MKCSFLYENFLYYFINIILIHNIKFINNKLYKYSYKYKYILKCHSVILLEISYFNDIILMPKIDIK